jgi:hypothetical protein
MVPKEKRTNNDLQNTTQKTEGTYWFKLTCSIHDVVSFDT